MLSVVVLGFSSLPEGERLDTHVRSSDLWRTTRPALWGLCYFWATEAGMKGLRKPRAGGPTLLSHHAAVPQGGPASSLGHREGEDAQ